MLAADLTVQISSPPAGGVLGYQAASTVEVVVSAAGEDALWWNPIDVSVYASTDGAFDPSADTLLGRTQQYRLIPFGTATLDIPNRQTIPLIVPGSLAAGAYTLFAVVDPDNIAEEPDETNNISAPVAVTLSPGSGQEPVGSADLAIALTYPAQGTSFVWGVRPPVVVRASNLGSGDATKAVQASLYYSTDTAWDTTDSLVNQVTLPQLSAGESVLREIEFSTGYYQVFGDGYFIAVIDSSDRAAETNESNNVGAPVQVHIAGGLIGSLPSGVDLTARVLNPAPGGDMTAGLPSRARVVVSNIGDASMVGPARVTLYLSQDGAWDAADTALGSALVQRLRSGGSREIEIAALPPRELARGDYHLFAVVTGAAGEADTTNNVSWARAVSLPAGDIRRQDLRVEFFAAPDSVYRAGESSVWVTLANVGDLAYRGGASVGVFLAWNDALAHPNRILVGSVAIPKLAQGQSRQMSVQIHLPADVAPDTATLYAQADWEQTVSEHHENDNLSVPSVVKLVAGGFDISGWSTDLDLPLLLLEGSNSRGSMQVVLANSGTSRFARDQRVMVQAVLRPATGADIAVSRPTLVNMGGLGAGDSRRMRVELNVPAAAPGGQYSLLLLLDTDNRIAEIDETNNYATITQELRVQTATTDLLVSEASTTFATVMNPGDTSRGWIRIANSGNLVFAGPVTVQFLIRHENGTLVSIGPAVTRRVHLRPQESWRAPAVNLQIPVALDAGTYMLVARVAMNPPDADPTNDIFSTGISMTV